MDHEKCAFFKKGSVEQNMLLVVQVTLILALSLGFTAARGEGRKLRRKFSRIENEGDLFNATTTLALEVQQRKEEIQNGIRNFATKRRKKRSQIAQGYFCNLRNDRYCRCHDNVCCSTNPGYQGRKLTKKYVFVKTLLYF